MNNFKTDIDNVNQIFENVLSNYKSNYVNFHTNATLSLPSASLIPVSETPTSNTTETTTTMNTKKPRLIKQKDPKDPNDEALLKYRYAANNLLEKVRSQINSNSNNLKSPYATPQQVGLMRGLSSRPMPKELDFDLSESEEDEL